MVGGRIGQRVMGKGHQSLLVYVDWRAHKAILKRLMVGGRILLNPLFFWLKGTGLVWSYVRSLRPHTYGYFWDFIYLLCHIGGIVGFLGLG